MGFYKNYLEKEHDMFDGEINIAKEMEKVKAAEESELNGAIEELRGVYHDYLYSYHVRSSMLINKVDVSALITQKKIEFLTMKKENIESQTTVDYFKSLFKREEEAVESYADNAYETMGTCIEKQIKLNNGGFLSTIYDAFGKKDELMKESSEKFEKANLEANCATEAKNEWKELSNMEKASILVARFKLTGSTEFNPEEMDEYAKEPHEEEFVHVDFGKEE